MFNTVASALCFLIFVDELRGRLERPWYALGGTLVLNVMLADSFVIQLLLDVLRPFPDLINRKCRAPKARTQARMNELWVMRADIYLAFRTQLAGKILVLACMFGSAIPLLFLVGARHALV